jgi:uncharacterized protein involved in exopolysaccharide biosynthesis
MNIDDRLRAASQALKESSVAQVDAASRLREIVQRTGQPVAHGRAAVLLDKPQESPRPLAPSLPPSGKASAAAAGRNAAAPPTSHGTDGETKSTFHSQPPSGNAAGRLLGSTWRYGWLITAAVLLGALLGYGWAARQPVLYEGVARVVLAAPGSISGPGEAPPPLVEPAQYLHQQAQLMRSAPVLERAVELSGRISAETLGQRLEVQVAPEADVLTIRVVDSTARGAARLANSVAVAYEQVLAKQWRESLLARLRQLQSTQSVLRARLADMDAKLARDRNDPVLRAQRAAVAEQLKAVASQLVQAEVSGRLGPSLSVRERAAVPKQPIQPSPGRKMTTAIGMLLGLLASALLVWWRTNRQGPTSTSSAPEQGSEMPRPN